VDDEEIVLGVVAGEGSAPFERRGDEAWDREGAADDALGLDEGCLDVPA
jgi:hypothetical protein